MYLDYSVSCVPGLYRHAA